MKKINFLHLEDKEEKLLRSVIKLLDKKKEFIISEHFDDNKNIDVVFTNNKFQNLITDKTCKTILISHENININKNLFDFVLIRPLNLQNIFSILLKIKEDTLVKNENRNVSNLDNSIFKICNNLLITQDKNRCLLLNENKEIYHNIESLNFENWINNNKNFTIEEILKDPSLEIEKYQLNKTFIYEGFVYLLQNKQNYNFINYNSVVILTKFPNIFPQTNLYQEFYKDFYHICFYISKKERNVQDISINLNISIKNVLECLNILYEMKYIKITNNSEKTQIKQTEVKSIFSKIKLVLGIS